MSDRLRVAIVGSGPAGFYAAAALLDADVPIEVDMIERLPTPWGLVRLGVAPDHPKLKTVSRAFERIAAKPGFRFFGNVEVGRDLTHADLTRLYDAVIYAFGSQTDRRLGVPGEDLRGSWSATEFVAWYNAHPDFQELEFDLDVERAVVIGNGNVALDVARMLALTPEELAPTDTTDPAIEAIGSSRISDIVVVGRRGPAQASWTTQELKELGELPFDERRGTIRNDNGRVVDADGAHVAATYCAGWIKRGPTGIIGTNKKDATETVTELLADVEAGRVSHRGEVTVDAVEAVLAERDVRAVLYHGWTSIDEL